MLTFASAPDYETDDRQYLVTATVSDGTYSDSVDAQINLRNVRDVAPEFTSSATFSADENQTSIGTVTATDAEGDTISFSISGSEINIDSSSGVLTFASAPDYETKSSYTATVTASVAPSHPHKTLMNINNVNDEPTFTSSATFGTDENQTSIGTVTTDDIEGDTITYSITGSEITIDSATGH